MENIVVTCEKNIYHIEGIVTSTVAVYIVLIWYTKDQLTKIFLVNNLKTRLSLTFFFVHTSCSSILDQTVLSSCHLRVGTF